MADVQKEVDRVRNLSAEESSRLQKEVSEIQNLSQEILSRLQEQEAQLGKKLSRSEIRQEVINYYINVRNGNVLIDNIIGDNANISNNNNLLDQNDEENEHYREEIEMPIFPPRYSQIK